MLKINTINNKAIKSFRLVRNPYYQSYTKQIKSDSEQVGMTISRTSKIKYFILSFAVPLLTIALFSCSQDVNGVIDLPYTEQIVVRAVLEAGQPVKGILLSKTMPTLDTFSIDQAELVNAEAYIMNNNIKYNLHYTGNGLYDTDSLIATSGETYSLTVKWNGKTVNAVTTVPFAVDFDSITSFTPYKRRRANEWTVGITARVMIKKNLVVVGGYYWIDSNGISPYIKTYISKAYKANDSITNKPTRMIVFSKAVSDTNNIKYDSAQYKVYLFVEAYDPRFNDYFNSRLSGDSPNSSFGLSGSNIKWNVTGDGVGLFTGYASSRKIFKGF